METKPQESSRVGTRSDAADERDPRCRTAAQAWRDERRSQMQAYEYAKETPETD